MQFLPRKWASGVQGVGRRGTVWKSEGGDEGRGEGGVAADATFPVSVDICVWKGMFHAFCSGAWTFGVVYMLYIT